MSNVPRPASLNVPKIATKIRIEAATSIIISFIAPYSRRPEPQTAISRYMGRTAVS